MVTIPFDPPRLLTARRSTGFVDIPETKNEEEWDGRKSLVRGKASNPAASPSPLSPGPTCLKRTPTMAGNIVIIEDSEKSPHAFWLQRKIGKISNGVIRLAYKLRPNSKPEFKDSTEAWELAVDESGEAPLVKVTMIHSSVLEMKRDDNEVDVHNPLDEMSALQMVAEHCPGDACHVVGTKLVATCSSFVYSILPYHPDGTLLQYCLEQGNLDEDMARFFFQQIIKGLKTLQDAGLCHRNLSLDAIEMKGFQVVISDLGWSLRFKKGAASEDEDKALPAPGGTNLQFIAPEYFGGLKGAWDGFAADLWAAGLMLYCMVVGCEALFAAPIADDKKFLQLCVKGKIGAEAENFGKTKGVDIKLSEDLVDLLQHMLKADPKDRFSLDQVMQHRWVTHDDSPC